MGDIYVHPCGVWFGGAPAKLSTVLGSCVAITLWHPFLHLGGMCHYMMGPCTGPDCERRGRPGSCYANKAMDELHARIRDFGCNPREFEAKLFGGGNMFPAVGSRGCGKIIRIQDQNIEAGLGLVTSMGHRVVAQHLGGQGHRHLLFDIQTGQTWLKHTPKLARSSAARMGEV